MPSFGFSFNDTSYRVEFSFDDREIMNDAVVFTLQASRTVNETTDYINATLEILPWKNVVRITIEGMEVREFELIDKPNSEIEAFLQSIPVPDPILGCAIKAGVSAIIGQAQDCINSCILRERWGKIQEFAECMRGHIGSIGGKALRRAFGCMISGGLL
jgi:hypothetical protein